MNKKNSVNGMYCDLPYELLVKGGSRIRGKMLVLKGLEVFAIELPAESPEVVIPGVISRVLHNVLIMKN